MEEPEQLKADLMPYLKLKESENILLINKHNEKRFLPIKELAKYHNPDTLPEQFFPKKGKKYEYYDIEIFTNIRIIFFCLNLHYLKKDGITPISNIFNIDNYLVWINNEDIKKCDIKFGADLGGIIITFELYHDDGENSRVMPMRVRCSDYNSYLKMKEIIINTLGFNSAKVNNQEQERKNSIRSFNRLFFYYGLILLAIFGLAIVAGIFSEENLFSMKYTDLGLYIVYVCFFISYNIHSIIKINKNREWFFEFAGKNYTWYRCPMISFIVFAFCLSIVIIDFALSFIISNYLLSFLTSLGTTGFFIGLSYIIEGIFKKKKKSSK